MELPSLVVVVAEMLLDQHLIPYYRWLSELMLVVDYWLMLGDCYLLY
jgi:hypothetical protein